jgi:hypothetical protein
VTAFDRVKRDIGFMALGAGVGAAAVLLLPALEAGKQPSDTGKQLTERNSEPDRAHAGSSSLGREAMASRSAYPCSKVGANQQTQTLRPPDNDLKEHKEEFRERVTEDDGLDSEPRHEPSPTPEQWRELVPHPLPNER